MAKSTYSFIDIVAALVGPGLVCNVGAGSGNSEEGITIAPTGEIGSMQIGADGYGQHSLYVDKSGTITIRLMKTSPTNQILSAAYVFQTASSATHGQNTLTLADKVRGDIITCEQVGFARAPDLTYAREAGMNEWVFNAIKISRLLGG
jgi:hypothetical protein